MTTEKIFSLEIKKLVNIDISTIYEILKSKYDNRIAYSLWDQIKYEDIAYLKLNMHANPNFDFEDVGQLCIGSQGAEDVLRQIQEEKSRGKFFKDDDFVEMKCFIEILDIACFKFWVPINEFIKYFLEGKWRVNQLKYKIKSMLLKFQKRAQALDYAYRKNGEIENDWIAQHLEYEFSDSNYQSEGSFNFGTNRLTGKSLNLNPGLSNSSVAPLYQNQTFHNVAPAQQLYTPGPSPSTESHSRNTIESSYRISLHLDQRHACIKSLQPPMFLHGIDVEKGLYFIGGSCGKVVSTMFNRSNRSDQVLIYDLIIGPVFGLHPKLQLYLQSNNLLKVHNSGNFVLYYFSVLVRSYGKLKIVKTDILPDISNYIRVVTGPTTLGSAQQQPRSSLKAPFRIEVSAPQPPNLVEKCSKTSERKDNSVQKSQTAFQDTNDHPMQMMQNLRIQQSSSRPKTLDPSLVSMTDQIVPGRLRTRPQQASYSQKNNEEEKIMPIRVQKQIKSEERPLLDIGEFESLEKMQETILEHYKGKIRNGDYFVGKFLGSNEENSKCYLQYIEKDPLVFVANSKTRILKEKELKIELRIHDIFPAEKPGFKILPISTRFDQNGNPQFKLKQIKSDSKKSE